MLLQNLKVMGPLIYLDRKIAFFVFGMSALVSKFPSQLSRGLICFIIEPSFKTS